MKAEVIAMLFRKKLPKSCSYCIHGTKLNDDEVLCIRKGIVRIDRCCMKFTYDPCKRIPLKAKASNFAKYKDEDFSL